MKIKSIAFIAVIFALMAAISYARFDLQSYQDEASQLSPDASVNIIKSFAVGSTNPTIGIDDAELRLEFIVAKKFTINQDSFLGILPGYASHSSTRSRVCIIDDNGSIVDSSPWVTFSKFTGVFVDSSVGSASATSATSVGTSLLPTDLFVSPYSRPAVIDPLRIFWKCPFNIAIGLRVRIEIRGLIAPPTFDDISKECLTAYGDAPAKQLLVNSNDCCKQFQLIIGTDIAIALPGVSVQQQTIASITASWCPNLGTDRDDCIPDVCEHILPSNWNQYYTNVCCAYSKFSPIKECTKFVCANQRKICPTDPKRCCDVETSNIRNNPICPPCSYGNFDSDKCCNIFKKPNPKDGPAPFEIIPEHVYFLKNSWQCAPEFCNCAPQTDDDDFSQKCCFLSEQFHGKVGDSAYYPDQQCLELCKSVNGFWNGCCSHPCFAEDSRCRCSKEVGGSYDPDTCCQDPATAIANRCPISDTCPVDDASPCCDKDCGDEESCSCLTDFTDENIDPTKFNIVSREAHSFRADDVQSGHNTILINHIHVETHVKLPDGTVVTLESMIPDVLMNVNSQVYGLSPGLPATPAQVIGNILNQVKQGVQSDINAINTIVNDVKTDVKNLVKETIGTAGGIVSSLGKPIRGILRCLHLPGPLSGLQLTSIRLLFVAQLNLVVGKKYNVKWINQYPTAVSGNINGISTTANSSSSEGYGLTYEVSEPSTSQSDLISQVNSVRSGLSSSIQQILPGATVDMTEPIASAASSSNSTGTQKEIYSACTTDADCLSSKCSSGICTDADITTKNTSHTISSSFVLICSTILVLMATVL